MKSIKVKICGIARRDDVGQLDQLGVDFAGIWWGIPNGKYNQPDGNVLKLLNFTTNKLKFILVTLEHKLEAITRIIEKTNVYAIQLHGFQLPNMVQRLKEAFHDRLKIIKVLHIKDDQCLEESMIERFMDAGVDHFLLDSYASRTGIGSTGKTIQNPTLVRYLNILNAPAFVAGGINDENITELIKTKNVCAVDIDSYVKNKDGSIKYRHVEKIMNPVLTNNLSALAIG